MKIKFITVFTIAIALVLSACGKSDADLQKAVTEKLTAASVTGVTVAVKDGVATLTGEVADAAAKKKAEDTELESAGHEGVEHVRHRPPHHKYAETQTCSPLVDDDAGNHVHHRIGPQKRLQNVGVGNRCQPELFGEYRRYYRQSLPVDVINDGGEE